MQNLSANNNNLPNYRKIIYITLLIIICLTATFLGEFYFHADIVYTHLFYLLIIVTGLWYYKKAIITAVILALLHVMADYAVKGEFAAAPFLRSIIFLTVAFTVGSLSESKKKADDLRLIIKQKELMMKEIQHRVKNNLSIISSLFDLEVDKLTDENSKKVFMDAQARITSMATIYERFYKSSDMDSVNLLEYIKALSDSISNTISQDNINIEISSNNAEIQLDSKRAVSLGLILNELMTNSLKYAYPKGEKGAFRVNIEKTGNELIFSVSDDGKGFPEGFNPEKTESMGLKIANVLARQLDGKLTFESGKGAKVCLRMIL